MGRTKFISGQISVLEQADKFIANGSDIAFSLSQLGFDLINDNYEVSINGLIQMPTTDYGISVVGGIYTITFISIPLNGSKIIVKYRRG